MYTSLAANDFFAAVVSNNHFELGVYTNITKVETSLLPALTPTEKVQYETSLNNTNDIEPFRRMIEGYNASSKGYKHLSPFECANLYNVEFVSGHRNLFLMTNHASNTTYNYTVLKVISVRAEQMASSSWMCRYRKPNYPVRCDNSGLITDMRRGLPWQMDLEEVGVVEITGCESEIPKEKCKVQFSLGIMIVVICCNLVKAFCMVIAVVRSREPTLVTLGQCSQPSGGPAGPRGGTAKSPGRDGTASCSPSRPPQGQDGRLWVGRRALQGETC